MVLKRLKSRERRTATCNLQACFPNLSAIEQARLLDLHFEAVGMSFLEMAIGWCWPIDRCSRSCVSKGESISSAR